MNREKAHGDIITRYERSDKISFNVYEDPVIKDWVIARIYYQILKPGLFLIDSIRHKLIGSRLWGAQRVNAGIN